MQERVYQKPIQDIDDLKRRLIAAWSGIHQQVIDQATDQLYNMAMHILNKVFDSDIALLASFVTVVDYSSSYEPTGLSFFVIFVHSAVVK